MLSNIQVQMGRRSLDLPITSATRLPTLSVLQHHTRTIFTVPANHTPVFLHEGSRIIDERRWSSLLASPATNLILRLQSEPLPSRADADELELGAAHEATVDQARQEPPARTDYFAVQGCNGNMTLYLDKADFDRRMADFAREGSLAAGMRAIFPPAYKDEYTQLFREAGAGVVVTTQATALLKQWQKNLSIAGGVLAGGIAGGLIAASSTGGAAATLAAEGAAATVAMEGAAATVAAEAAATAVVAEATAGSSGAAAAGVGLGASAVAAVAVGYLTFRGLKWLLPEVRKEPYTILMSVPDEDLGMLEMGRQMSVVESHSGPSCGICMERPQDAAAIPCGHTACRTCMDSLIRRHGSPGETPCPHCRNPIREVQRLYM
eukprot:gb/GFBE01040274.1/.p1 GENE.gb/GFBE01040274.1/~~gb/GFBE01040274.1/.p1  ORF type:complete len:378 (+),score=63.61 gb/GFBE01040274.1/:1-1134(+)